MQYNQLQSFGDKLYSPAAHRNSEPILEALRANISNKRTEGEEMTILEIASGTGQHIVYFARYFTDIVFQPSEFDVNYMTSIRAYIAESGLPNIRDPVYIDIRTPYTSWASGTIKENSISHVVNTNMLHITEFECTENLFKNVQRILKPGGLMFTYGPFKFNGIIVPESNVSFDMSLRQENPEWGLRDLEYLNQLAAKYNMPLQTAYDMPANNHLFVWKKK